MIDKKHGGECATCLQCILTCNASSFARRHTPACSISWHAMLLVLQGGALPLQVGNFSHTRELITTPGELFSTPGEFFCPATPGELFPRWGHVFPHRGNYFPLGDFFLSRHIRGTFLGGMYFRTGGIISHPGGFFLSRHPRGIFSTLGACISTPGELFPTPGEFFVCPATPGEFFPHWGLVFPHRGNFFPRRGN